MSLLTTLLANFNSGGGAPGTIVAPVVAATTANFAATYNNGASGIGATLVASSFGAFTIDGVSPSVGQRVLIKNQSSQLENGIYIVSATGGIISSAVLTRATDFDEPSEITDGVLVEVANGTINSETLWQQINNVVTIGVDAIAFTSVSSAGFTASRALVTNANGKIVTATTTATEIGYVNGVTSSIQTQLNTKISALTSSTGLVITGSATPTATVDLPRSILGVNLLYNGSFQVWQRGTSFTPGVNTFVYGPDRWQVGSFTPTTATTYTRIAGTTSGSFRIRQQRNSGNTGTGSLAMGQSLTRDMSIGGAGQVVTISFSAASGANFSATGGNLQINVFSGTGTTDVSELTTGFAGQVQFLAVAQPITSTMTRYSVSATVPSNATQLAATLGFGPIGTAGAADYVDYEYIKLEISPSATNFVNLPYIQEFARCQAFYQIWVTANGWALNGVSIQMAISLNPPMRATPTAAAPIAVTVSANGSSFTQSSPQISAFFVSGSGGIVGLNNFSGLTGGWGLGMNGLTGPSTIVLEAELV